MIQCFIILSIIIDVHNKYKVSLTTTFNNLDLFKPIKSFCPFNIIIRLFHMADSDYGCQISQYTVQYYTVQLVVVG